jgi:hypothetical protein
LVLGALVCGAIFMIVSPPNPEEAVTREQASRTLLYEQAIASQRPPVSAPEETSASNAGKAPAPAENDKPATAAKQPPATPDAAQPQDSAAAPAPMDPDRPWLTEEPDGSGRMAAVPGEGADPSDPYGDMPPMPGQAPGQWGPEGQNPDYDGTDEWGNEQAYGPPGADPRWGQQSPEHVPPGQDAEEWVQVTLSGAEMRAGAADDAPLLFAFPYGRELRVTSRYEGWAEVTDPQSAATGWMKLQYLAPSSAARGYEPQYEAYYEDQRPRRRGLFRGGFADMINRALGGD